MENVKNEIKHNPANKYDYVLQMFAQEDSYRPTFKYISFAAGYAYAISEAMAVIRVPIGKCGKIYPAVEKYPSANKMYDEHVSHELHVISTADLLNQFAEMDFRWRTQKEKCKKCSGEGEIKCDHCDNTGNCKPCRGTGVSDIEPPFAQLRLHGKQIKVFNKCYSPRFLNQILLTALAIDATSMTFSEAKEMKSTIIRMDLDVEILIMPQKEQQEEEE